MSEIPVVSTRFGFRALVTASTLACLLGLGVGPQALASRNASKPVVTAPRQAEPASRRDARMAWWREARFGMFVHWGLYAVLAGEYQGRRSTQTGEWIMSWANIPRAEYERLAPRFDPVAFDAAAWVRAAKDAGMRYLVVTSKHHDGFCLFDSRVTRYDIVDATPYGRDVLRALSDEARRAGLRFGVYYSILDWHHPAQYVEAEGKHPTAGHDKTRIHPERKAEYVEYMKTQLREIVTGYDPSVLWFDGEWVDWWTEADGRDLYDFVRGLRPDLVVNNRVGKGRKGMEGLTKDDADYAGDFGTPEQEVPASGLPGVDWESCMTMNDTWGFKADDRNWKSDVRLVRTLVDVASKGGNYLLNVGPTAEGSIPAPSLVRLSALGRWMAVNGEAIYGTSAGPFASPLPFGRATARAGRVYLHVFDWPASGKLSVPAFGREVGRASLLARRGSELHVSKEPGGWSIALPARPPDATATVIVLEQRPARARCQPRKLA